MTTRKVGTTRFALVLLALTATASIAQTTEATTPAGEKVPLQPNGR